MTSIGTGYDLSTSTYSPDGRIFQVEYANKAVENSATAIGIRCKDGVVLAIEKLRPSKLLSPNGNKRILSVDRHVGIATTGLLADGRQLVTRARYDAQSWRNNYREPISCKSLAERVALYVQAYTLYSSVRPFGCSSIIASADEKHGPSLFMVEPSGIFHGFRGVAIGKGRQLAKTELEKLKFDEMDCRQAVLEAARIIHLTHDEAKDREFELEMSWVGKQSKWVHEYVPLSLAIEADSYARQQSGLAEEMDIEVNDTQDM